MAEVVRKKGRDKNCGNSQVILWDIWRVLKRFCSNWTSCQGNAQGGDWRGKMRTSSISAVSSSIDAVVGQRVNSGLQIEIAFT
jgi:hypothetical protein